MKTCGKCKHFTEQMGDFSSEEKEFGWCVAPLPISAQHTELDGLVGRDARAKGCPLYEKAKSK